MILTKQSSFTTDEVRRPRNQTLTNNNNINKNTIKSLKMLNAFICFKFYLILHIITITIHIVQYNMIYYLYIYIPCIWIKVQTFILN